MSVALKLGLFVAALVAVFGAATALGNGVDQVVTDKPASMEHDEEKEEPMDHTPGGLQVAENGYRFVLDAADRKADPEAKVSFTILGPEGKPLTEYATLHDKDLHLILAKRDLSGFQHVHPTLDEDGTWTADVALTPGQWRAFADFDPAGKDPQLTLGADLSVAGDFQAKPLPKPSRTYEVDGYTVTLDGDVTAGKESELTLTIAKDGEPVTDLEPYLAAYGHLVALRVGDLAYLHVHPAGEPGDGKTSPGPEVTFFAQVPSAGAYRLYLDFKHDGTVRTAEFTVDAADAGHAEHAEHPEGESSHAH